MPASDQHPSPERLIGYQQRRLGEHEAEEVRAHLVACADCTAQLLALAELLDGEGDSLARSEMPREELDAAWKRQRDSLFPVAPVASLAERRAGKTPRNWSWAAAASLGLAAMLAVVVFVQWRTIERLTRPLDTPLVISANPPLVNLVPAGSRRSGSQEVAELRFPQGAPRAWVILNPAEDLDSSPYDVVIATADGKEVVRLESLRMSEAGNLRLEVPRSTLKEGDYSFRVVRQRQVIEEFKLRVRYLL